MSFDFRDLNPVKGLIDGVGDLVDKFIQTPDEKAAFRKELLELGDKAEERSQAAMRDARDAYRAEFEHGSHTTKFDSFVDGMNRLVRPVVTYGLLAAVLGVFDVPTTINVNIWTPLTVVLAFWFGGRLLSRDGGADVVKGFQKGGK